MHTHSHANHMVLGQARICSETNHQLLVTARKRLHRETVDAVTQLDRTTSVIHLHILGTRKRLLAFSRAAETRYPENDTVTVYEPPQKNTGIIGGKFMAREKVVNPDSGHFFTTSEFKVGAEVTLRSQKFCLVGCDGRTAAFLADNE